MEQLIRDMDAKIRKNKERAEAESRPKVLKLDDQRRLDDIKMRQAGAHWRGKTMLQLQYMHDVFVHVCVWKQVH
jgi:hypothetical protein